MNAVCAVCGDGLNLTLDRPTGEWLCSLDLYERREARGEFHGLKWWEYGELVVAVNEVFNPRRPGDPF